MNEEQKWIRSDAPRDSTPWHLGRKKESRGAVTGRLISTYYLTACSGRSLGGPWGYSTMNEPREIDGICSRCESLAKKGAKP